MPFTGKQMGSPYFIPELPAAKFKRRLANIKPLVRRDGRLYYIAPVDPVRIAYTWAPKFQDEAFGLTPVRVIRTLHSWSYYGCFKPSISEVLSQIPDDLEDKINAFEITRSPETAADLNRESEALNAGYHVAETTLYTRDPEAPLTGYGRALVSDDFDGV